jgi:hypothetical protein
MVNTCKYHNVSPCTTILYTNENICEKNMIPGSTLRKLHRSNSHSHTYAKLPWKGNCICILRGGNWVVQRNGAQMNPSLGTKVMMMMIIILGRTGVWTQGFTLARQALHYVSHASSPGHKDFIVCASEDGQVDSQLLPHLHTNNLKNECIYVYQLKTSIYTVLTI